MTLIKRPYHIEYGCVCTVGKLRKNNEDNFCCNGQIIEDIYSLEDHAVAGDVSSADNALFAVFDGMGGEACGEIASYTAALEAKRFCERKRVFEVYLYELAEILNAKVLQETEDRSLVLMGTTCAMVEISGADIYILNAGDSRVYQLRKHELNQVSCDHIALSMSSKAITKFLGMPNPDEPLSPYIAQTAFKQGDVYLLCTDGITDMLDDDEIKEILDTKNEPQLKAKALIDAAMEKGGLDNATALVLRLVK